MTYKAAVAAVDESIYVSHLTTSVLTLIFKLIGLGSCHDGSSEVEVHELHCSRVGQRVTPDQRDGVNKMRRRRG